MLNIPDEVLINHSAILGKTGSGKSYLAQGVTEYLLERGDRVCVIDPTGRWWGLKSNAAGTAPGFPVVIFGGNHGDVSLEPTHGEAIAEIVGTSKTPTILDTRLMTVGGRTRFFADFAEALLRKNRGPLHLIIDEAHLFAPQGRVADPQSGKMLHAANNLVSLGRGIGLRITLITQRPAKLHKDSLTQVETLIAMRLIAPHDRRAVEDWIGEWADPKEGKELLASLASLKTGTCWVWAPEINMLAKRQVPRIKTFDSGRPLEEGEDTPILAAIDLPSIEARLETAAINVKANDPTTLKERIAELERELRKATKEQPAPDPAAIERVREETIRTMSLKFEAHMEKLATTIVGHLGPTVWDDTKAGIKEISALRQTPGPSPAQRPERTPHIPTHNSGSIPGPFSDSDELKSSAARSIVAVLAARHPARFTWQQAATLAGLKARGGHFNAGRKELRDRGLIHEEGGLIELSDTGYIQLGSVAEPPQTPGQVREMWCSKLPSPAPEMITYLAERGDDFADRESMAIALGKQPRGGHWNSGMAALRNNGLIELNGGLVRLCEEMRG